MFPFEVLHLEGANSLDKGQVVLAVVPAGSVPVVACSSVCSTSPYRVRTFFSAISLPLGVLSTGSASDSLE